MPESEGERRRYGVDHCKAVEGLDCKALRANGPGQIERALRQGRQMAQQYRVPVVVECTLERVTNIALGTEIDNSMEFEEIGCRHPEGRHGPERAGLLD